MRVGTVVSSKGAAILLALLIVSIGLGPRFRLGALDDSRVVDIRLQDLLLPIAALVAFASVRGSRITSSRPDWWRWCLIACYSAVLVTIGHLLIDVEVSAVRRLAFLGRHLMIFAVAAVVSALYCRVGAKAGKLTLHVLVSVVVANASWFAYQILTGQTTVLIGQTAGEEVASYGPKLIGEPSSAGTGTFFAFSAALALAAYRADVMRWVTAALLFTTAAACAYLSESRTALVSIICLAGLFVVQSSQGRLPLASRIALAGAAASGAAWYVMHNHSERLSASGLDRGAQDRLEDFWSPILQRAVDDPVFLMLGVGPGGLPSTELPFTEAHNILLRAWLDFGLIGGVLFLATLSIVGLRAHRLSRDPGSEPFLKLYAELAALYALVVAITGVALDSLTTVTSTHLLMLAVGLFAGAHATQAAPAVGHELPGRSAAGPAWQRRSMTNSASGT